MVRKRVRDALIAALALGLSFGIDLMESGTPGAVAAGGSLLAFWMVAAARFGRVVAIHTEPGSSGSRLALRVFLFAYVYILLSISLLGAVGRVNAVFVTLVGATTFVALASSRTAPDDRPTPRQLASLIRANAVPSLVVIPIAVITIARMAWAAISPVVNFDDLTYHLVFPVEWMQHEVLKSKMIPFGGLAHAYFPKNTELIYTWALLPLRQLSHIVGVQFAIVGALVLALFDTFRLCGATSRSALLAAVLICLCPAVEVSRSYVDVTFGLFFVMAIWAGLAFRERATVGRWLELCMVVGVFVGTKALGLLLSAAVLVPFYLLILFPRRRALQALSAWKLVAAILAGGASLIACGGWWYVRNLVETGNPVFPLVVKIFGAVIFDGVFSSGVLAPSRPESALGLYLPAVLILVAAGALVTSFKAVAGLTVANTDGWNLAGADGGRAGVDPIVTSLVGVVMPLAVVVVFWLVIPFDAPRYIIGAFGLSCASLIVPLNAGLRARGIAEAVVAVAVGVALLQVMPNDELHVAGSLWLIESPEVWSSFALCAAALAGAALLVIARVPGPGGLLVFGVMGVLGYAVLLAGAAISDPVGNHVSAAVKEYWDPYLFIHDNYGDVKIATTGSPAILGAYGPRLSNRVRYVNVNEFAEDRLHDHVRRRRRDIDGSQRDDPSGARYYRGDASYAAWVRNLEAFGADLLVANKLPWWSMRRHYVRDRFGFPLEVIWAGEHPETFRPVYRSKRARVYEISHPGGAGAGAGRNSSR